MRNIIILFFVLVVGLVIGISQPMNQKSDEAPIDYGYLIGRMELAREYHQWWVDHPVEFAELTKVAGNTYPDELQWVKDYSEVVKVLRGR